MKHRLSSRVLGVPSSGVKLGLGLVWFATLLFLASVSEAQGPTQVQFPELWEKILRHAPELKVSEEQTLAADAAKRGAQGHWFPRLSLGAQYLSTDAPGSSLFLKLGTREVGPSDFAPNSLNQPDREAYWTSGLQLDVPLYEGGRGQSGAEAADKKLAAAQAGEGAARTHLYLESMNHYRDLITLRSELQQLLEVDKILEQVLKGYQVGRKENPVGYSGLLGLRGLSQRLAGLKSTNRAQQASVSAVLSTRAGGLPTGWEPRDGGERWLSAQEQRLDSVRVNSQQLSAQGDALLAQAEKSRSRPQVGAKLNWERVDGERGAGEAVTGAVYVQWELWSAQQRSSYQTAYHQAQASQARAQQLRQQEVAEWEQVKAGLDGVQISLKLLTETGRLLDEQMRVSQKLFASGSLNALQLTEVLSRRVDVILDWAQAERQQHQLEAAFFFLAGGQAPTGGRQ
ncbi:MAG: TolC family protein [Bdellovibrionales bacterium]|nr:TolC family protein [Bdellovibrionales bacterium]